MLKSLDATLICQTPVLRRRSVRESALRAWSRESAQVSFDVLHQQVEVKLVNRRGLEAEFAIEGLRCLIQGSCPAVKVGEVMALVESDRASERRFRCHRRGSLP